VLAGIFFVVKTPRPLFVEVAIVKYGTIINRL
jgi:hypothetical protein